MHALDRNQFIISGVVGANLFYRPGRFLRFTLIGSSISPFDGRELRHYQDVFVPGPNADAVHAQLTEGAPYCVNGPLVYNQERRSWAVRAFAVTPIYRETKDGRLEDAISWGVVIGTVARAPSRLENQYGVLARAVLQVEEAGVGPSFIPLRATQPDMAEALASSDVGNRIVTIGPLMTEKFNSGGQNMRQSTLMIHSMEYIGETEHHRGLNAPQGIDEQPLSPEAPASASAAADTGATAD